MNRITNDNQVVKYSTDRTCLQWAQWMADKGITVFIAEANSKRPLGGRSWYQHQSTDPQQIADWFNEYENCNYGLHLGEEYVVVDLDVGAGKNGIDEFDKICKENDIESWLWELPTLMVESPSGGYHLYFKTPHPCANKNYFPAGIDVRGAIGYVIGPGSKIKATGEYKVINPDAPIMDIPEFLLEYLEEPGRKDPNHEVPLIEWDQAPNIEQAIEWLKQTDAAVQGEEGDQHTYDVCCMLRDFGISETEAFRVLNESGWNERCDPSWDDDELEKKIENAYYYAQNRPGEKAETYLVQRLMRGRSNVVPLRRGDGAEVAMRDDGAPENVPRQDQSGWRNFAPRSEAVQDARPAPEWLIEGVIQRDTLNLFYGPENSFKSFLVLDLALSAAAKRPWAAYGGDKMLGGYAPARPLTTVYIAGEGAGGIEQMRRPAWRKHYGVDSPLPFFTIDEMPIFKSADDIERLTKAIRDAELSPDLIVVDTAARAMLDLDENSVKDTGLFIAACDRLKREFRCAVLVVHHSGKDDRKGSRGSSNLPASFDARFKVKGDTASLVATIKNEKQKDGEPWSSLHHFQGHQVSIENGRSSLVFTRNAPSANSEPTGDERRITEVRAALVCKNGDTELVANKVLATTIVDRRLETDPVLRARSKLEDIDRMVENERRKLLRQARNKANGGPGLLRQFVAGDPTGDVLWTLPADTDE